DISRRRFIGSAALAAAGVAFASKSALASSLFQSKPNSKIHGVQIGVITYSFRSMPSSAEQLLQYMLQCNINMTELMGDAAEAFAGAPARVSGEDMATRMKKMADWRAGASMDKFKELRKLYNDAGVTIYAWKPN